MKSDHTPITLVETTLLEDGAVLVDRSRRLSFRLDRCATLIWLRLLDQMPFAEISREVAGSQGNIALATSLVESLNTDLIQAGLLSEFDSALHQELI
jgi:predicted ATPase